ncbi:ABC transporter permease [Romboutsia ilealis]|uniref:FtsX-like permease family protein n=1 Tax=Romboutsia faecis TaxID=2764597 RepID=A0ABR7JSL6_9FIRM|nr:FtsX-like permease family protein [Romboutsia faecis]MBC5997901.1 FtsX-like permease family protein [Romboutsia faecis]MRN25596.1 ABC transporter permease [Romboutsia ilealis]
MYSKIAIGNVKKSFKDYSIYFLTLTLAVCIFYSFNSIESQKAILELNQNESENLDLLLNIISYISVFVSGILGCLIVYANNFLIKKRKKELGIYMTLGMGKQKISKILTFETMLVGFISLLGGLILGIALSQGLSVFTSNLFDVSMGEYRFVISTKAIGKTILYFGIIFILVTILNTFTISKYKIIDLLNSSKKNEDIKVKNPIIYIITFILGMVCIVKAYSMILTNGITLDLDFTITFLLGVLGTILLFFSLAGFGLNIIKKSKTIYFKNLNIFIVKQLNNKINTNFMSMSVICLMLFLTIVMLSTGLSFKDALEKSLEQTTPFDATAIMYMSPEDNTDIEKSLKELKFKFDDNEKYAYYNEYSISTNLENAFKKHISQSQLNKLSKDRELSLYVVKESEYNKIMELANKKTISLKSNEVLVTSNSSQIVDNVNSILNNNNKIDLNNKTFIVKNKKVITDSTRTSGYTDNLISIVVNDDIFNMLDAKISANYLNVNYDENNREKAEKKYESLFNSFFNGKIKNEKIGFIIGNTKDIVYSQNKGMTTIIIFIGIYLGIVFLISSMAVLSLQQLSEASDSIDRYKSLKRIGANDKMINKTIFIQTLIYFTLPLALAFVHSVVGIKVVSDFISAFGKPDIGLSSLITGGIFIVIYMGYFYATYTGYKNIIKNS